MKKILSLILAFTMTAALTACSPSDSVSTSSTANTKAENSIYTLPTQGYSEADIKVPSREIEIPATLTLPAGKAGEKVPLVVMNHGHGGSRHENGGFDEIARALAEKGIASIRPDFSGCGDSSEIFRDNCIFNMTIDANACLDYAVANAPIDTARMGIFGYSMGGRIALEIGTLKGAPYKAIGLLAPSADKGEDMMIKFLGGQKEYDRLYAEASSEKKYTTFNTQYGTSQELSMGWFEDMKLSDPLKNMVNFKGNLLVVYGTNDTVVDPAVSKSVGIAAKGIAADTTEVEIDGADHGYGFYDDNTAVKSQVVTAVADFFSKKL